VAREQRALVQPEKVAELAAVAVVEVAPMMKMREELPGRP